ncbi:helix-turn-helix domain-containing protein [Priestia koreensis]|uniref:helix-turn-helix domain-containing protein n=1 Tax=Priestia koreensis TaxID=284581 RepID=UPI001F59677C|nr:helix-turn-helix transcriptional regulator [Priestia koreensis]UNL87577.1 helix-turn-helix transcriptional regulator [Priestia koreensis]
MDVGAKIKFHRLKKGLTQEELARGIISIPYLSKIENAKITSNQEILQLLFERLSVPFDIQHEDDFKAYCYEWFKQLRAPDENCEPYLSRVEEIKALTLDDSLLLLIDIHFIQYYLYKRNYQKSAALIASLKKVKNSFTPLHSYYYHKFIGNHDVIHSKLQEGLSNYQLSLNHLSLIQLDELELADIKYVIGITYSRLRQPAYAVSLIQEALMVFKDHYELYRSAQCHITLGICYRRFKDYDKSIHHYLLAHKLSGILKNTKMEQLTNLNLGHLHHVKGKLTEAISYYEKCLTMNSDDLEDSMVSAISLVRIYYDLETFDKANELLHTAMTIQTKYSSFKYDLDIEIYKELIRSDFSSIEGILIDKMIPYLQKNQEYSELLLYAQLVSTFYEKEHKYKKAFYYQKLVNDLLNKFIEI